MEIVVYSTPTCGYCHQLKRFLAQRGVNYTERDVSADPAAAAEMVQKTGQRGVPVTVIDGQAVVGFDRARLEHLLDGRNGHHPPSLGVSVADASKFVAKSGGIPLFGALVGGVRSGSLGERIGLMQGDIITEVNLRPVRNVDELGQVMSGLGRGSRLVMVFRRGAEEYRGETVLQ